MALKLTYDELILARAVGQQYINKNPERTPLHYALEKFIKKTQRMAEDYADKENDIRVDCALIDKDTKKFVLMDDKKSIAVDPIKAKEFQKKMRELGREEVTIENPHFATSVPDDLEAAWFQQFVGIVIREDDDPLINKPELVSQNGAE
jgi:hypothetical protein